MDHCTTCGVVMPERGPNSPLERYCQDDWYDHQMSLPIDQRHHAFRELRK